MHHANHFYGHAHIMAEYAGVQGVPRIWGFLQHGWNIHDGFAVGTTFVAGYPKLVWSNTVARRGWALGLHPYVVVGAPWAYLLEQHDQHGWEATEPEREGTIVYPFHGWEGQQIVGSHEEYMREIREVEGDVPITVSLYINEYRDARVRRIYESLGARVITHGERGYMWKNTDVNFLRKQLAEIRRHRRVVSNRASSALFYGASAGAQIGIYGDPMEIMNDHAILGGSQKPHRLLPELYQPFVPLELGRQLAAEELGQDALLNPAEVREAFGWQRQPLRDDGGLVTPLPESAVTVDS
ncbi:hypothetical protein EVU97_06760 [Dermacoccus sp. 147Ba]|uniref:hypothetical protein n=1 Tax=Dermacoccus sp. 147Ba TaxID=2510111 RepID=UPI00101C5B51|nr:hypothetical protein [Dermacoccus sp. 147Ba]RYI22693.1 hypothetical protein EVU97_06760 [Dermacoccus sp. 147Ba]